MRYIARGSHYFIGAVAFSMLVLGANSSIAQTANSPNSAPPSSPAAPAPTASADVDSVSSIKQLIATNSATPKSICGAIKPILYSDPNAASAVIETAQSQPQLMEPLCECLSQTQTALKGKDPEGAKIVAKAVSGSSPAFQACYAVALAPTDGATPANATPAAQVAATGTPGGGGNFAPFSALATPNNVGFGGGPVVASPN